MRNLCYAALLAVFILGCKENTPMPTNPDSLKYSLGVLISNEGPFSNGSGTLSWYDNRTNAVENNVFQAVNGFPLGSVFQSICLDPALNQAYMVINNSQKIVVTNLGTLKQKGEILGFSSPRYMLKTDFSKAYVTDWISNTVAVVDLNGNAILGTIPVGNGPERMLAFGTRVLVANSGGFGIDSTITVINGITDAVENTYTVGHNPNSMVVDANGALWILCGGINDFSDPAKSTPGKLVQFDVNTGTIIRELVFPSVADHPVQLCTNKTGSKLYWLSNGYAGAVFEMQIQDAQLPTAAAIPGTFYALNVDVHTNEIYTADALDFQQEGILRRYTTNGSLLDSVRVGVIPGGIHVN